MLPRFKSLGVLTLLVACCLVGIAADVTAQTKMDSPKQGWAQVPGGTVWLNPGDAYEHSTGLVRDRNGVKRYPTTPQTLQPTRYHQPQPAPYVAPAVPAYQPYVQPAPYYAPPQPVYYPAYPSTPYYAPQVDYGPYLPRTVGTVQTSVAHRRRNPGAFVAILWINRRRATRHDWVTCRVVDPSPSNPFDHSHLNGCRHHALPFNHHRFATVWSGLWPDSLPTSIHLLLITADGGKSGSDRALAMRS